MTPATAEQCFSSKGKSSIVPYLYEKSNGGFYADKYNGSPRKVFTAATAAFVNTSLYLSAEPSNNYTSANTLYVVYYKGHRGRTLFSAAGSTTGL